MGWLDLSFGPAAFSVFLQLYRVTTSIIETYPVKQPYADHQFSVERTQPNGAGSVLGLVWVVLALSGAAKSCHLYFPEYNAPSILSISPPAFFRGVGLSFLSYK